MGSVRWYGKAYERQLIDRLDRNVEKAAVFLGGEMKRSFGKAPSAPGIGSGLLRRSISNEKTGKMKQKVGSTLKPRGGQPYSYPLYLEYGTRKMKAYPWARPSLDRNKDRITRLVAGG